MANRTKPEYAREQPRTSPGTERRRGGRLLSGAKGAVGRIGKIMSLAKEVKRKAYETMPKPDKGAMRPLSPKEREAAERITGNKNRSRINKATDAYRNRAADGTEGASRAKATRMAPKPVIGEAARPRGPSAYQIAKQRATRRARRRPAPPNRKAPGSR